MTRQDWVEVMAELVAASLGDKDWSTLDKYEALHDLVVELRERRDAVWSKVVAEMHRDDPA